MGRQSARQAASVNEKIHRQDERLDDESPTDERWLSVSDVSRSAASGTGPAEDRILVAAFLEASETGARDEMERSFRMLVIRYQERVHKLVYRYLRDPLEAEDVTQDVFLKVFRKLSSFQGDSAFYTWLYRISVNTASDHLAKRKRRPVQLSEDVSELAGDKGVFGGGDSGAGRRSESPDSNLLREEMAYVTRKILDELPENYRRVLYLREFEDLSYLEIAEALACSIGTVESRLFRARARFRKILEERYPELLT